MKSVIDTNVLMSGIFFKGPPYEILKLWKQKKFVFVISEEVFEEYVRVGKELSKKLKSDDLDQIISLLSMNSIMVKQKKLKEQICTDKNDDIFIACALAGNAGIIISGDKHLLDQNGVFDLEIIKPRVFLAAYFPGVH